MKTTSATACVSANGGSDRVGAIAFRAGTFTQGLHDPDKDIEVEDGHRADRVIRRRQVVRAFADHDAQAYDWLIVAGVKFRDTRKKGVRLSP